MAAAQRIVELPYAPRRSFVPYHIRTTRWASLVAHRRCGKTVACVNDTIGRALQLTRPHGRYAYVAPFLAQAKEVAWEYLKRFSLPAAKDKNESELWVELLNGARIRIHGADNPDRLRGAYLDGVVLDEYADMRPSVWGEVIRPMLADRQGWATFIGTPKGRNEFFQIHQRALTSPDWYAATLKASDTKLLPQSELDDARRDMTPEQYEQEFECSFDAAILGAYFGKQIAEAERQGRIRDVPYDPAVPVFTAWDLGIGDPTVIWFFQVVGSEIHFIDHYEAPDADLDRHAMVRASKPYKYELDFLPHDAKARELIVGRSRVEHLAKKGLPLRVLPRVNDEDKINAGRLALPRCWFDREKCEDGLEALRQYRAEYDEKIRTFKNTPKHDWSSHSADAFMYAAMGYRILRGEEPAPDPIAEMLKPKTLNDYLEELDSRDGD